MNYINEKLHSKIKRKKLQKIFLKNKPFAHVIIENFLNKKIAYKLKKAVKKEGFGLKSSDLFQFSQTNDLKHSKNKDVLEFCFFMDSKNFSDFIFDVTKIRIKNNKDMFASLYKHTDYLLCHDDRLSKRRIAYIFYLSENFTKKDGGALALLSDKKGSADKVVKRYIPKFNSLAIFEVSKKSWHEVEEVLSKKERYAIGGWLY